MAAPKKSTKVALDPVVEAQNLLLEIEQANQDIADDLERDMLRAVVEQEAVMKENLKKANAIRYTNIHMANIGITMCKDLVIQCKNGLLSDRNKELLDLMYKFDKEDGEAALKRRK